MAIGSLTCTKDRTCSCRDTLADGQTHRQTDAVITVLRSHIGGGVKIPGVGEVGALHSGWRRGVVVSGVRQ